MFFSDPRLEQRFAAQPMLRLQGYEPSAAEAFGVEKMEGGVTRLVQGLKKCRNVLRLTIYVCISFSMYLHMICVFEVYRYLRPPYSLKSGFRVPQEMVSGSFCSYFQHSLAAKRVWMPYTMGCVMKLKYSLYHCSLDIRYISGGCKQSCEHHDDWLHILKKHIQY